jgi:hypothetical protein
MATVRYKVVEKDNTSIVEEIHKVIVHRFRLSDVDDPDIYAAEPIWNWQQSDPGKFVMEHAVDQPEWHRHLDAVTYGYQYIIVAELEKKKLSEFYLRWGNPNGNSTGKR